MDDISPWLKRIIPDYQEGSSRQQDEESVMPAVFRSASAVDRAGYVFYPTYSQRSSLRLRHDGVHNVAEASRNDEIPMNFLELGFWSTKRARHITSLPTASSRSSHRCFMELVFSTDPWEY